MGGDDDIFSRVLSPPPQQESLLPLCVDDSRVNNGGVLVCGPVHDVHILRDDVVVLVRYGSSGRDTRSSACGTNLLGHSDNRRACDADGVNHAVFPRGYSGDSCPRQAGTSGQEHSVCAWSAGVYRFCREGRDISLAHMASDCTHCGSCTVKRAALGTAHEIRPLRNNRAEFGAVPS